MFKFVIIASLALASQLVAGVPFDETDVLYGDDRIIADYCRESRDFLAKDLQTEYPAHATEFFFYSAKEMNTGPLHFEMEASPEDTKAYKIEWYTKACAKLADYKNILEEKLVEAKAKISVQHPEENIQNFLNTLTGIDKVNCLTVQSIDTGNVACRSFAQGKGALVSVGLNEED